MRRSRAIAAEVEHCGHQGCAQVSPPEVIGGNPCCERMAGVGDPLSQRCATAAALRGKREHRIVAAGMLKTGGRPAGTNKWRVRFSGLRNGCRGLLDFFAGGRKLLFQFSDSLAVLGRGCCAEFLRDLFHPLPCPQPAHFALCLNSHSSGLSSGSLQTCVVSILRSISKCPSRP